MSSIYPTTEKKNSPYYVEFERGDKQGEFTIFRRQWMYSDEEIAYLKEKRSEDSWMLEMCNEGHPWNIFAAEYGPDGCVPDQVWVKWMVDALNNQFEIDIKSLTESLKK